MNPRARIAEELIVRPGAGADLGGRDTGWSGPPPFSSMTAPELDATARRALATGIEELADAQELLWASNSHALLIVFQAIDAAGKDSTIKHVMSGVNPQGVKVTSFKRPSTEELAHDFLWRATKALPARGEIGIFNRSHYEEVVALRVHPEWLEHQHLPAGNRGRGFWSDRCADINRFERHLDRSGTRIVKFFLHVSKEEQKRRFFARLDNPAKQWKFSAADVTERGHWDEYMQAYDAAISATSTSWAPWYVVPADHKKVMQAMVTAVLVETIASMDLSWPTVTEADRQANAEARRLLESEDDREPRAQLPTHAGAGAAAAGGA